MAESRPSYVHGASATPLVGETIGQFIEQAATRWANRDALVSLHQGIRWSYRELLEQVDTYAAAFLALGLEPGDRIGIWSHNNAEWLITQLATARVGLVLVNINPAYRRAELVYALNKVGCRALITMAGFKTSNYIEIIQDLLPELAQAERGRLRAAEAPALEAVIRLGEERTPGFYNFAELPALVGDEHRQRLKALQDVLQFDDPINIQFTSGTTGSPKGATLSHHNILNNGLFVGEAMRLTETDRLCIPVPLYHCFGMVLGNLACLTHGSAIVYAIEAFEPEAVLRAVEAERCTGLHGVPTMFIAELNHPRFGEFNLTLPQLKHI